MYAVHYEVTILHGYCGLSLSNNFLYSTCYVASSGTFAVDVRSHESSRVSPNAHYSPISLSILSSRQKQARPLVKEQKDQKRYYALIKSSAYLSNSTWTHRVIPVRVIQPIQKVLALRRDGFHAVYHGEVEEASSDTGQHCRIFIGLVFV